MFWFRSAELSSLAVSDFSCVVGRGAALLCLMPTNKLPKWDEEIEIR